MDASDKTFSEIWGILKSWIPWRSEPSHVSRDFWMPDQSCRVCYECDSQFTIFNRRHHCRLCGRVFCGLCTENSIPAPSVDPSTARDEWEKIRVCNYCFKQWQQGTATPHDGTEVPIFDLCTSPSAASFVSTKSSGTANCSSITPGSMPYSVGPYQQAQHNSVISPGKLSIMETSSDRQGEAALRRSNDLVADIGEPSPNQYAFPINRLDISLLLIILVHCRSKVSLDMNFYVLKPSVYLFYINNCVIYTFIYKGNNGK